MPKRCALTSEEKAKINAYHECGKSHRAIAKLIERSQMVVSSYLKNPARYDMKKKRGVKSKLTPADKRRIARLASNSTRSSRQIVEEMQLPVTPKRVRQIINSVPHLKSAKMKLAPRLKPIHITARLEFARENMARDWKIVGYSASNNLNIKWSLGLV